jgi:hypothetical protein
VAALADRGLWLGPASMEAHRADLAAFVDHAMRLDDAAVIRLHARSSRLLTAWMATGFDVLASRVVVGKVRPADMTVAADGLAQGLSAMDDSGYVDPGFAMDSAWRSALPPESGFTYLDDVPAQVMLDLATCQGAQQFPRPAGVTARSGGHSGQLRRRKRGPTDALCVRVDRNGLSAAVTGRDRQRRNDQGEDNAVVVASGRQVRLGVPPARASVVGVALTRFCGQVR